MILIIISIIFIIKNREAKLSSVIPSTKDEILVFAIRKNTANKNNKEISSEYQQDTIDILGLNLENRNVNSIFKHPFPQNTDSNPRVKWKLRGLVDGNSGHYYFLNSINIDEFYFFKISINITTKKAEIGNVTTISNKSDIIDYIFTGIDSSGTTLLLNIGHLVNLDINKSKSYSPIYKHIDDAVSNEMLLTKNSVFLDDNTIINQGAGAFNYKESFYCNNIAVVSSGKEKNVLLKFGIFPSIVESEKYIPPIAVSGNKKYAYFLSIFPSKDKNKSEGWLCELDIKKKKAQKILVVDDNPPLNYLSFYLRCCKAPGVNLMALFNGKEIQLFDINKRQCIKKIKIESKIKSMRWSMTGNRLGILDFEGRLFIYDMDKNILIEVDQDQDYFDFIWTE